MSPLLIAAAVLVVAIGAAHSYLGERYILIRLFRRENLPRLYDSDWFTKRTLRFAWHITTLAWLGFAALLLAYARAPGAGGEETALWIVAATFAVTAVVAAAASRGRHLSWVAFLAIALLTGWAAS